MIFGSVVSVASVACIVYALRRRRQRLIEDAWLHDTVITWKLKDEEVEALLSQCMRNECHLLLRYILEHYDVTPSASDIVNLVGSDETPNKLLRVLLQHRTKEVVEARLGTGWSSTLAAAAGGNTEALLLLLDNGGSCECEQFHAVGVAAFNGHVGAVRALLDLYPEQLSKPNHTGEMPLHMAARGGHWNVVLELLNRDASLNESDKLGNTALHMAAFSNVTCIRLLVQAGAKFGKRRDGFTPLHTAVVKGKTKCIRELLHLKPSGLDLEGSDKFGQTALHIACSQLQLDAAVVLIENGADINAKDHDGLTPLHALLKKPSMGVGSMPPMELYLSVLNRFSCIMGEGDNEGYTPMHIVSVVKGDTGVSIAKEMVALGCDPTMENRLGWTPIHLAHDRKNIEVFDIYAEKAGTEWMKFFDPAKPKKQVDTIPSHIACIPMEQRKACLNDVTLMGICKLIASGKAKNIVVLTGAGISVSSGIPDYRSKDGVYRQAGRGDIPVRDMFSEAYCLQDPVGFYSLAVKLFHNKQPSLTHKFLNLLNEKGLLKKIYTQNVDGLERKAGIPDEKVVQCHGTFERLRCIKCRFSERMIPSADEAPVCPLCNSPLRPDVVFFGEGLPDVFHARHNDMNECDLLIVMGTSLVVYPFAGLPNEIGTLTPRLLINKEPTGPWKNRSLGAVKHNYRDVFAEGSCDEVVKNMVEILGWDL